MQKRTIHKILIPTDFSVGARRASKIGIEYAKQFNADVILFHSFSIPVVDITANVNALENLKSAVEQDLKKEVQNLREEYGDISIEGIFEFGPAVDWIQKLVEEKNIDLIVMGTKGETDAANLLFGSVTTHVINNVTCPVLVIPKGNRNHTIKEILFATDFHFTNDTADYLAPVLRIIDEFEPFVHVVSLTLQVGLGSNVQNVEKLKLKELFKNTKHSFHYVETDNIEKGLLDFANKNKCDLIVMLTRHYSLWDRIFHKSLSKKIALHSEIPMLFLHEK